MTVITLNGRETDQHVFVHGVTLDQIAVSKPLYIQRWPATEVYVTTIRIGPNLSLFVEGPHAGVSAIRAGTIGHTIQRLADDHAMGAAADLQPDPHND